MKKSPPSPTHEGPEQGQPAIRNVSNTTNPQPSAFARSLSSRPALPRQPPNPPSSRIENEPCKADIFDTVGLSEGKVAEEKASVAGDDAMGESSVPELGKIQNGHKVVSGTDTELGRLKEAVEAKLLLEQQRARLGSVTASSSPGIIGSPRVSKIKDGSSSVISPSLADAFNSPDPVGARTNSTESTASTESARTIRGSIPPTPAQFPSRTPSYPFPYVPGTPQPWTSQHQPFTNLSPSRSESRKQSDVTPSERNLHGLGMPSISAETFAPAESGKTKVNYSQSSLPNLYDLVLSINSELGIDAWWANVTQIMQTHYGAERVTLAMPADAADIENVPWGQKATFSTFRPRYVPETAPLHSESPTRSLHKLDPMSSNSQKHNQPSAKTTRPRLESRHSFAGHERGDRNANQGDPKSPPRPRGPPRTKTYAIDSSPFGAFSPPKLFERHGEVDREVEAHQQERAISDLDFSGNSDPHDTGPERTVFSMLRALDSETDPLLDTSGVNRILERGKLVTITRNYAVSGSERNDSASKGREGVGKSFAFSTSASYDNDIRVTPATRQRNHQSGGQFELLDTLRYTHEYAEYEQIPNSPWAQSPAPSPAIQADPDENPFFTASAVDEDSFNPTSTEDYSKLSQVEAIGVDRAKTVVHIPLMHPILSKPIHSVQAEVPSETPKNLGDSLPLQASSQASMDVSQEPGKREPLAILSVLSSVVPYPQELTQSLSLLGPHLATSLANALQYSRAFTQSATIRRRQSLSSHTVSFALDLAENVELGSLMQLEIDDASSSAAGSITSPSEYSSRSVGSAAGTPGWDPSYIGFSKTHGMSGTPGLASGAEAVDNYFDAKKRANSTRSSATGAHRQGQHPHHGGRTSPPPDNTRRLGTSPAQAENEDITQRNDRLHRGHSSVFGEQNEVHDRREQSPPTQHELTLAQRTRRRINYPHTSERGDQRPHSFLHSYGADFSSSFQSLPAATTPVSRLPTQSPTRIRGDSTAEIHDMPPPSERLLRTIIDSLPVQIFTAAPGTGTLTWFNTKFLVYRGQESRRALEDPWQVVHPEDRVPYSTMWKKCLQTGQQLQQKVRLQRFDGQYRWFYVRAAPLKDKRQNIVHWIGTNMDIHDQHIAEMNLARQQETAASEAKYRNLANSSPQIVFAVTRKRGLTFCNTQWPSYSGQTEEEALGLGFMDYVHPEDLERCKLPEFDGEDSRPTNVPTSDLPDSRLSRSVSEESHESTNTIKSEPDASPSTMQMPQVKLSELASTGILRASRDADGRPSYSTEVRLRSKDGDFRWHLVRVLLSESGNRSQGDEETWYGTCTDINDHKVLEQTLKETMDAKSRFLSNMSHEIRTPLNGITGMVNFLIDSNLTIEQLEHVNIIRASTEGLRDLINDILDLSKVEAGMVTLTKDWLHVRSVIEEVNDLTSPLAIDKGIELNYILDENVPSMVKGDRFRIRQVLLNIVGNGIKFTQHGEVFVRCTALSDSVVPLAKNEILLQFDVIDTGTGFSEKEAQFLFKRFSQIDGSSTRQHGGSGLGLVISMQLVELHGGKMKASSVPGEGSTFTFTIQVKVPSEADHPPLPSHASNAPFTDVQLERAIEKTAAVSSTGLTHDEAPSVSSILERGDVTESPAPLLPSPSHPRDSPGVSSGSSVPSIRTIQTRGGSGSSSVSSLVVEATNIESMKLSIPPDVRAEKGESTEPPSRQSGSSEETLKVEEIARNPHPTSNIGFHPTLYSILVVCPLKYSQEAVVKHIEMILPRSIPHQITQQMVPAECQALLSGETPVIFTHLVLGLQNIREIISFIDLISNSPAHSSTCIVVITDLAKKREIMKEAPQFDYERLTKERRLQFLFKPIKPSKLAIIFDPRKEREMSKDRFHDSAQRVAISQKRVYDELNQRLGHKGLRVLLVEDNKVNQMVILKFLGKISVGVETAIDGAQCVEKVFSKSPEYYSIILCDLHMPNKDGYETCKEIREWERKNKHKHMPIVALSANVLGDVYENCVEAGFNSYVTKPVDFKELSVVMTKYLDPADPSKPHEFMQPRQAQRNTTRS